MTINTVRRLPIRIEGEVQQFMDEIEETMDVVDRPLAELPEWAMPLAILPEEARAMSVLTAEQPKC